MASHLKSGNEMLLSVSLALIIIIIIKMITIIIVITLQRCYNMGAGSHKTEPCYK